MVVEVFDVFVAGAAEAVEAKGALVLKKKEKDDPEFFCDKPAGEPDPRPLTKEQRHVWEKATDWRRSCRTSLPEFASAPYPYAQRRWVDWCSQCSNAVPQLCLAMAVREATQREEHLLGPSLRLNWTSAAYEPR